MLRRQRLYLLDASFDVEGLTTYAHRCTHIHIYYMHIYSHIEHVCIYYMDTGACIAGIAGFEDKASMRLEARYLERLGAQVSNHCKDLLQDPSSNLNQQCSNRVTNGNNCNYLCQTKTDCRPRDLCETAQEHRPRKLQS